MKNILSYQKKTAQIFTTMLITLALVLSCLPVPQVIAQSQPSISWSPQSLNITLAPGGEDTKIVSFTTTKTLSNVKLEVSPEIARFLTTNPNLYGRIIVPPSGRQNITLSFKVPLETRPGTYMGTVKVQNGNQILPQSLNVTINVAPPSPFTLYTNPTDPLLLESRSANGTKIEVYGERDANGSVSSVSMVRVITSDGKATSYLLDDRSRPIEIQGFNGVKFKIKYLSETRVFVDVISSDGLVQLSVPMDLNSVDASQSKQSVEVNQINKSIGKKLRAKIRSQGQNIPQVDDLVTVDKTDACQPTVETKKVNAQSQDSSTVTIEVKQCGIPSDNAVVNLEVGGNFFIPSSIPVPRTGTGIYQTTLPSPRQAVDGFNKQCQKIADAVGDVCTGFVVAEGVFAGIATLSAFLLGSGVFGAALGAAAVAVLAFEISVAAITALAGITAFCTIIGGGIPDFPGSGLPEGAPNIFNAVCGLGTAAVNRFIAGSSISLSAIANIEGIIAPSQQLSGLNPEGPFEKLLIDLPASELKVKSVTVNPTIPDSSQGYSVNAELGCADPADNVTISYTGKDGSQGTNACPPGSTSCSLSIPGGRTSSQDVIVIRNNNKIIKVIVVDLTQIGSITVRDNGSAADDAFRVALDGKVVGQSTVGGSNEFSIKNLSAGLHTLTLTGVVVPDDIGTYEVSLRNGLTFAGGGTVRSGIVRLNETVTFTVIVP